MIRQESDDADLKAFLDKILEQNAQLTKRSLEAEEKLAERDAQIAGLMRENELFKKLITEQKVQIR